MHAIKINFQPLTTVHGVHHCVQPPCEKDISLNWGVKKIRLTHLANWPPQILNLAQLLNTSTWRVRYGKEDGIEDIN